MLVTSERNNEKYKLPKKRKKRAIKRNKRIKNEMLIRLRMKKETKLKYYLNT